MPRQPRLNLENGVYHVTQRGLERRDIALTEDDRRQWLRLLDRHATRCGWRVFAYALLSNHFHLFLRTPQPNLSEGMQAFESGYVSLFNRHHERQGPLFQSRFHAVLVEFESHARELTRYVHLNPHRAGLDPIPGAYDWCSLKYYFNPTAAPTWLDWWTILTEFAPRESAARIAYRRFVMTGTTTRLTSPLSAATDDGLLGSPAFIERYQDRGQAPQNSKTAGESLASKEDSAPPILNFAVPDPQTQTTNLLAIVAREFDVPISQLTTKGKHNNWPRDAAIWICYEQLHQSYDQLTLIFGGTSNGIREALRRTRQRLDQPAAADFRVIVERIVE